MFRRIRLHGSRVRIELLVIKEISFPGALAQPRSQEGVRLNVTQATALALLRAKFPSPLTRRVVLAHHLNAAVRFGLTRLAKAVEQNGGALQTGRPPLLARRSIRNRGGALAARGRASPLLPGLPSATVSLAFTKAASGT